MISILQIIRFINGRKSVSDIWRKRLRCFIVVGGKIISGVSGNDSYRKEYQRDKLESLIAEFRLQKVRKNLGDQLSGGERRRTEIARCLAISPKFIMLDEPFAGVDPIAVEDIQSIVYK